MTPRRRIPFPRLFVASLTAGVLVGSVAGTGFVIANRYLSAGYPQLALDFWRSFLSWSILGTGLVFILIELTYRLLSAVLRRTAHGPNSVLWVIVATGGALWALGRTPWVPEVRTGRGFLLFAAVTLTGACAARLAARHEERLRRGAQAVLRGLGGVKPAVAALVLLAGVNAGAAVLEDRETTRWAFSYKPWRREGSPGRRWSSSPRITARAWGITTITSSTGASPTTTASTSR